MKDLIAEFDQTFDSLIPQVNNNSHQINIMFNAINELQDLAKQNGWKIRTNLSSTPAIYNPSDIHSRSDNRSYLQAGNINQYGEPIDLMNDNRHLAQNNQILHSSDDIVDGSQKPKSPHHDNAFHESERFIEIPKLSQSEYSSQRRSRSNLTKNKISPRNQGGSVRFSLKSDQPLPAREYHQQEKEHISRNRNNQSLLLRNNSRMHDKQYRSTAHSYQYREERRKMAQKSPEFVHQHGNDTQGRSIPNLIPNINLDGDLNILSDVGIVLDSKTNSEDRTKNDILARISL